MCRKRDGISSIIEELKNINCLQIQDVYDFYRRQHNQSNENFDDEKEKEENKHNKDEYAKINGVLMVSNDGLRIHGKRIVFLSHSHDDFEYAYRVALFLKTKYNVEVYIDELDSLMPLSTNSDTAEILSKKIGKCDRFIFVGTESSFKSKWCNWELGVADFKRARGHLAFFVMNDHPAKNGNYRKNEYVGLYPFIWDKNILNIHSDDEDLFVGYFENFDDKELFITLKDWLYNDKNYFKPKNAHDKSKINEKKTMTAFYFSKFKDNAIKALGYRTLSEAFSDIASHIGGTNNTYMLWRRYEFNIFFENLKRGIDNSRLSQRVRRDYDRWNEITFEDFTFEIRRMIGK